MSKDIEIIIENKSKCLSECKYTSTCGKAYMCVCVCARERNLFFYNVFLLIFFSILAIYSLTFFSSVRHLLCRIWHFKINLSFKTCTLLCFICHIYLLNRVLFSVLCVILEIIFTLHFVCTRILQFQLGVRVLNLCVFIFLLIVVFIQKCFS